MNGLRSALALLSAGIVALTATGTRAAVSHQRAHYFKTVSAHGVSFQYGSSLASGVRVHLLPALRDAIQLPPRIDFTFDGYLSFPGPDPKYLSQATSVRVYRTSELARIQEFSADVRQLRRLIRVHGSLTAPRTLPYFLPQMDSGQLFHARERYIRFTNGSGVVYLTANGFNSPTVTNAAPILYTFDGLTDDGKYAVVVSLPVHAPGLSNAPTTLGPRSKLAYARYLLTVVRKLDSAPAGAFIPYLQNLDRLTTSLAVHPVGLR